MAEHFDCKEADGFSSALESVRSLVTPTTFRSAVAALMVSGCASNGLQQSVEEPKPIPVAMPKTREVFMAVCQATGSFNLTSKDDLLMETLCAKPSIGGGTPKIFQVEDMEIKRVSEDDANIILTPFENEARVFVERTRDQVVVTLNFQGEDGSYYIELPPQKGMYQYSFMGIVSDMVEPKVHWRSFGR